MFFDTLFDIRYAYARAPLLAKLYEDRATIDAVIKSLGVPIAHGHRGKLSDDQARKTLKMYVNQVRALPGSPWHGLSAADVAAAAAIRAQLPAELRAIAFPSAKREDDLRAPVAAYMRKFLLTVYEEVPTGRNRADLFGRRRGPLGGTNVVVELKNSLPDFKRGMDQVTTYASYAHEVWIACTPWLAARYLDEHARGAAVQGWDPRWLEKKLAAVGCGLLLVEDGTVSRVHEPRGNTVDDKNAAEVRAALQGREPVT